MKKTILLIALSITFSVSAQSIPSTTYFAKPLELKSVPISSSKADSVLVRGTDKIVKFVPRSEFASAKIPTLQEVFDASKNYQEYGAAVLNNNLLTFKYVPSDPASSRLNQKLVLSSDGLFGNNYVSDPYDSTSRIYVDINFVRIERKFNTYYWEAQMEADRFVVANYLNGNWESKSTLSLLYPKLLDGTNETQTLLIKVNNRVPDVTGNVSLSSVTTTFTTNDGKLVTVTDGVITNVQPL